MKWVSMLALAALALSSYLHCGCAAAVDHEPPEFSVQDREAIEATIDVWSRNTLPYNARCVSERMELHVLAVPQEQLDRCRLLERGRGAIRGCYVSHVQSIWVPDDADPSLRSDVVVHETLHWLHECNWGHTDYLHTGLLTSKRAGRAVYVWATQSTQSLEMQAWANLERP